MPALSADPELVVPNPLSAVYAVDKLPSRGFDVHPEPLRDLSNTLAATVQTAGYCRHLTAPKIGSAEQF